MVAAGKDSEASNSDSSHASFEILRSRRVKDFVDAAAAVAVAVSIAVAVVDVVLDVALSLLF